MSFPCISLQKSEVLWWDASSVAVRCPFCDNIHRHGFTGYEKNLTRRCHCDYNGGYYFAFPFDEGTQHAYYAIDKKRALFVTVGADPSEYFGKEDLSLKDLLAEVSRELETKRKWYEATESYSVNLTSMEPFEQKLLPLMVSEMIFGEFEKVKGYLETSREADLFLFGIDAHYVEPPAAFPYIDQEDYGDQDDSRSKTKETYEREDEPEIYSTGKTALHFAACEKFAEIVQLLLEKGADPNARDNEGRTPLAYACLWGRLNNVKLLLEHGAEKTVLSVRHQDLLLTIDYARDSNANMEYRHSESSLYSEDSYQRNKDRRVIMRLLENPSPEERRKLWGFAFTKAPQDTNMVTMSAHFDIKNEWKTVGVLWRGDKFPTIAAMSGWNHSEYGNTRVSGKDWTAEVMRLCELVAFTLRPHIHDQGIAGQYHACHAEKQLIAYFMHEYHFLPFDKSEQAGNNFETEQRLERLIPIQPSVTVKKAEILVSRPICLDCRRFVKHINSLAMGFKMLVLEGSSLI